MEYKLKVRKEASVDFHQQIIEASYSALEQSNKYPFATCLNCISFEENKSYCKKHKASPPPRVIVYSCPDYFDIEDVPF